MLQQFIRSNRDADVSTLALQRKRYPNLSDSDFRFALQQIDGRQRSRDKHPTFVATDGWLFPPKLNLEQSSSEQTAQFKASLIEPLGIHTLIDATGGYGVDTFFMSAHAHETHYFEQNAQLAALAEHNFRLTARNSIHVHPVPFTPSHLSIFNFHLSPFPYSAASSLLSPFNFHLSTFPYSAASSLLSPFNFHLSTFPYSAASSLLSPFNFHLSTLLYIDPARRDTHGGKVFRLEDCTPNILDILSSSEVSALHPHIMLKLSPMLDISQALAQLSAIPTLAAWGTQWQVYIVSIHNEVKELLLLSGPQQTINGVILDHSHTFTMVFTPEEEQSAVVTYMPVIPTQKLCGWYIYEPDAAIRKAGAFRLLSARYHLYKADTNTHLYLAPTPEPFAAIPVPGRLWRIDAVASHAKQLMADTHLTKAHILTRNYPLTADDLRKKLRLQDGQDISVIGCRIAGNPLLLRCTPVNTGVLA